MPAFDADRHAIDPKTGFQVDKDTGHLVGVMQQPQAVQTDQVVEFPKWIVPHDSQILRQKAEDGTITNVSTPGWPNSHVNRSDGSVTVLVADEEEEKRALGEYQAPKADAPIVPVANDATLRAVRADVERARQEQAETIAAEDAKVQEALVVEEAARRVAEQAERDARAKEAAVDLAKAQRDRLAEKLSSPPPVAQAPADPPKAEANLT